MSSRPRRATSKPARNLIEHVWARLDEPVIDGLEMKPANIIASHMLAAIASALRRNQHWRNTAGLDHQLLLATALQCNKPKGSRVDAVTAGGQQPVIAMNGGLYVLECRGDAPASFTLDSNGASFVVNDDVILEKARRILRDWIKRPSRGSPSYAVNRMSMTHGYDVGMCLVHGSVQHEACSVECMAALTNLPLVIGQYQI